LVGAVAGAEPDVFDFIVEFEDMLFADGLMPLLDDIALPDVVMLDGIVLVVETGAGVLAGVVGLLAFMLLAGVSPQAIPNAPRPKTAESTITFFICLRTPIFLKD
jgi:hypothetical protein